MAILDFIKSIFSDNGSVQQSDIIGQFKNRYPKYKDTDDSIIAKKLASKYPDRFYFMDEYKPNDEVPPQFVPKSLRTDKFYEKNPDIGKSDAINLISRYKETHPKYANIEPYRLAGALEKKYPDRLKGLASRIGEPAQIETPATAPSPVPAQNPQPKFTIPLITESLQQPAVGYQRLSGPGQLEQPSKFQTDEEETSRQALEYVQRIPAAAENKLIESVLKSPEDVPGQKTAKDITLAAAMELAGIYRGVTGQELEINPESLAALHERRIDPGIAMMSGQIVGGIALLGGVGKAMNANGLAENIGLKFARRPEIVRYLAPMGVGAVEFGGAGAFKEGLKQVKEGNLDLESFGKVVLKDTAMGASLGAVTGVTEIGKETGKYFIPKSIYRIGGASAVGYGSAKLEGKTDLEAAVDASMFGLFTAVVSKDITKAQQMGALKAAKNNVEIAVENEAIKSNFPEKAVSGVKAAAARELDRFVERKGGLDKFTVEELERAARDVHEKIKGAFGQYVESKVEIPGKTPGVKPSAETGQTGTITPKAVPEVPSTEIVPFAPTSAPRIGIPVERPRPITANDLVESRTREEITQNLDKIFGPESLMEKVDEGEMQDDKRYYASNKFRADLEYAAANRDLPEAEAILNRVMKRIKTTYEEDAYVKEAFKAQKESSLPETQEQAAVPELVAQRPVFGEAGVQKDMFGEKELQEAVKYEAARLYEQAKLNFDKSEIEQFVIDNGGIAAYKTKIKSGKIHDSEEYSRIPVRLKKKTGLQYDKMLQLAQNYGLIPTDAPYGALYEELKTLKKRGKPPKLEDFDEEAKRNIEYGVEQEGIEAYASFDRRRDQGKRIQVSPISGGIKKSLSQIAFDVSKGLGQKLFFGKTSRGTAGLYYPGSTAAIIRYTGDLDTTAHELAHALDDKFGIISEWNVPSLQMISPFDNELAKFWWHGSVKKSGPKSRLNYKRNEGVAEFVRALMVNPDEAIAQAPKFYSYFTSKVPEHALRTLNEFSKDIRSFAGASAHEKIMANVEWEPPDNSFLRWFSRGNSGPGFNITWADKMRANWQDSLQTYNKAIGYAKKQRGIGGQIPSDDPMVLARLYSGIHAKMDDIFTHGMINANNERTTKGGIPYLLEPLDSTSVNTLEKEMQEVVSLMIAERTIEKAKKLGKSVISGVGGGIEEDADVARRRIEEAKLNPEKFARITEAAKRYREWGDSVLLYLRDKGRISTESYERIKANNEQYIAMRRLMEVAPGEEIVPFTGMSGGNLGSVGQPIKKFVGSTRTILNPYSSLLDSTYRAVREADRNDALMAFRDLLTSDRKMGEGPPIELASIGRLARAGDKNTISIYVNGEREVWQFQEDVYKALKGLSDDSAWNLPALLTAPARFFRSSIVNFPPFLVRNVIRDFQQRLVISDVGSSIADQFRRRGPMQLENLKLFGGDQSGHYLKDKVDYFRAMRTAMKDLAKDKNTIVSTARGIGKFYLDLSESSERSGRMAEYKAAFRHAKTKLGYDDFNANLFAASKARGLLDFAVAGHIMREINRMIPFSNAAIQGFVRTAKSAKENPKDFMGRWSLYVLFPSILTYLWNAMHGDSEEYRQQPAYLRDLFYNFKVGDDVWLRIPKSFEIGVMASGVERLIDKIMGNKKAFDGYTGSVSRSLLPVDESAIAGPFRGIVQTMANYDFFRQKAIVPRHEEKLKLEYRDVQSASRLGKLLQSFSQKVGLGVDARNMDHILRETAGFFGQFATELSDIGRKDKPGVGLSDTGLFVRSPAYASIDVQWVMREAAENGLTTSMEYKQMQRQINRYFEAQGRKAKDQESAKLRKIASIVRDRWEDNKPLSRNRKIRQVQMEEK